MIRRKRRSVSLLQDPWTSTACLKGNHMWLLREKPPPMSIPSESPSRRGLPRAAVQRAVRGKTSLTWVRFHLVLFFFSFKAVCFFFFLTLSFLWNLCNYWIFFQSGFDEGCWLAGFFFFFLCYDWVFQGFEFGRPLLSYYNLLYSSLRKTKQLPPPFIINFVSITLRHMIYINEWIHLFIHLGINWILCALNTVSVLRMPSWNALAPVFTELLICWTKLTRKREIVIHPRVFVHTPTFPLPFFLSTEHLPGVKYYSIYWGYTGKQNRQSPYCHGV